MALVESLSCSGVRIWKKQTIKDMRGKVEEGLVWKKGFDHVRQMMTYD